MEQEQITGKWKELKGEIQNQWGRITNDDLDRTKGNMTAIAGLIEQRYGGVREAITEKLNSLMARFADKTEDVKESMKLEPEDKAV